MKMLSLELKKKKTENIIKDYQILQGIAVKVN